MKPERREGFLSCSACPAATPARCSTRSSEPPAWPIDGYLISCPYYSRPSQRGLELHFRALADRASHPVLLYNIPYRTGVNLGNEAMLRLAAHRQHRRPEGLLRRPQPVARPAAPAPAGLRRADRRGRAISRRAERRRRRRHPGVGACRDRDLRGNLAAARGGRARCRADALAFGRGSARLLFCRAEPGADQALAVAHRIDRQRRRCGCR